MKLLRPTEPLLTTKVRSPSLAPALGVLVALACSAPWLSTIESPAVALLLAGFLTQCVLGLARSVLAGYQLLATVFWSFSLCYLAVPAMYQVSHNEAAWGDNFIFLDEHRLATTLVALNTAYLMFALGQAGHLVRGSLPSATLPRSAPPVMTARTYVTLALLLLPLVISRSGGVAALVSSRHERTAQLAAAGVAQTESGGVMVALVAILPGALALAATLSLLVWWRKSGRRFPITLGVALVLLFLFDNPFANTRYISTVAIFSIVFLLLQPRTRRAMLVVTTCVVVGVLAVYPLANVFRGDAAGAESLSLADNDFDAFQQLVNTTQYVEDQGHTWGAHLGSATLFFVPRRYWPDKAVPASIPVAENRGYTFTNLSLPLPGELYLEFGLAGMAVLMFGWGRLWRRLDRRWASGASSRTSALVPYLAIAQLGFLRGPVGSMVPIYGSTVLLLLVALRPLRADAAKVLLPRRRDDQLRPERSGRQGTSAAPPVERSSRRRRAVRG